MNKTKTFIQLYNSILELWGTKALPYPPMDPPLIEVKIAFEFPCCCICLTQIQQKSWWMNNVNYVTALSIFLLCTN